MNVLRQAGHVFKKDMMRFWPGLVGLAALGAYHRFVGLPPTYSLGVPFAGDVPVFSLALIALAAVVVQDDPASSQNAHWRTTPLRPGAVFLSKSAFLGLFLCLLPALAQVQWVASRAPVADPGGMLLDALLFQGGLLAAVGLGASITPNLGAFLTLAVAGWFGLEFYESTMLVRGGEAWPGAGEMLTRAWFVHGAGLLLGGGLFLHQYLTRHLIRTLALGVAGFGGVLGGLAVLEPDMASGPMIPDSRHVWDDAGSIDMSLTHLQRTTPATSGERTDVIVGMMAARGPAVHLVPTRSRTNLAGPDLDLQVTFGQEDRWQTPWYDPTSALPGLTPASPDRDGSGPSLVGVPLVEGAPAEVTEMGRLTHWETTVNLDAFDFTIAGRMPLEEGFVQMIPAGRLTILEVSRGDQTMEVDVRLDVAPRALQLIETEVAGNPAGLVLHNTKRGEYVTTVGSGGGRSYERPRSLTGGPQYRSYRWTLSFGVRGSASGRTLPSDWFDDVELVALGTRYLGSFERTIDLDVGRWPEPNGLVDFDRIERR